MSNKKYRQTIRDLSDRIVNAQRPLRILDGIKWNGDFLSGLSSERLETDYASFF